jgi:hypothetical protein
MENKELSKNGNPIMVWIENVARDENLRFFWNMPGKLNVYGHFCPMSSTILKVLD